MAKGMTAMTHSADRYNPSQMLTFYLHLPLARYDTPEKQAAWYAASLDKLRSLPGVKSAEITTALPVNDDGGLSDWQIENRPLAPGNSPTALRIFRLSRGSTPAASSARATICVHSPWPSSAGDLWRATFPPRIRSASASVWG
jgi:hypothetical protein